MKFKSLLTIGAAALLMASCADNKGKSLEQITDATPGDSLVYYFGEINGSQYLTMAQNDSTFATDAAKRSYVNGVKAGLNSFNPNDEAFNRGMHLGLQMARNISEFKKDYDVALNKQVFIDGLVEVLNSDSIKSMSDIQREFNRIMNDFSSRKETIDKENAAAALSKEAAKMKLAKVADGLYGGPTDKMETAQIKEGDDVTAKFTLKTVQGKTLDIPLPSSLKVGARNLPIQLSDALQTLKSGQNGKFITTANDLFGRRAEQFNLAPKDVIVMDIVATIDPKTSDTPAE
ncbi:MAG: FKBP-type peptidyl-prolyl cis-trans isomerase N-terminal domain-containing protein [Muribaculaceae bacterium]|nr:FKBP-type peptidyl-prolyl cis-trans isomerase N-terminal domain-containing protein [Muribaculaceae bacterium]